MARSYPQKHLTQCVLLALSDPAEFVTALELEGSGGYYAGTVGQSGPVRGNLFRKAFLRKTQA